VGVGVGVGVGGWVWRENICVLCLSYSTVLLLISQVVLFTHNIPESTMFCKYRAQVLFLQCC
jgi:hypothetical protein